MEKPDILILDEPMNVVIIEVDVAVMACCLMINSNPMIVWLYGDSHSIFAVSIVGNSEFV